MYLHTSVILIAIICDLVTVMAHETQHPLSALDNNLVYGNNGNTTYCTVPRSEQLFGIEFFEVAPIPLPLDRIFFTYLQGYIQKDVTHLEDAKLRITISVEPATGNPKEPDVYTIPLASFAEDQLAHITVRHPGGKFGGPLQHGWNDIVTDYWFPGALMERGQYTFKIEGFIPGNETEEVKYLFAFQLSQWLEGTG